MELSNHEVSKYNSVSISNILFLVGSIILLIAFKDKAKESGITQLIEIPVVIHEKPFYVSGSRVQSRIVIRSKNYSTHFWITDGSLDLISNRNQILDLIYGASENDTLWIGISERDKIYLYQPNKEIKTYSLRTQESVMFNSNDVKADIEDKFINYLIFGGVTVALGLLIILKRMIF